MDMRFNCSSLFKSLLLTSTLLSGSFMLSACGQENDVKEYGKTKSIGQFIDSPVANLDVYQSGLKVSTTDNNGYFEYTDNIDVTFKIGKLILGTTKPRTIVTPLNLSNNKNDIIEILVALQSLDEDQNPDNGIYIAEVTANQLNTSLDLSAPNVTLQDTIKKDIPKLNLVPQDEAVTHFINTANQYNISSDILKPKTTNETNLNSSQNNTNTTNNNNVTNLSGPGESNAVSTTIIQPTTTQNNPTCINGSSNSVSFLQGCNSGYETE